MTTERVQVWPATEYLDRSALRSLLDDLGGDTCTLASFITDFVDLWDTRARRLAEALAAHATDAVHVVLLSIRSSAHMIGAVVLEASTTAMLDLLQQSGIAACASSVGGLIDDGRGSCQALVTLLAARRA